MNKPTQLTLRDNLNSEAFRGQIAAVLPKHMTPDRMVRVATTALLRVPKLAKCEQASFFQSLLQLSQWGLEPDGRNAHLIPFENRKRGVVECQLILDYKGIVELAMRSGQVASIHCDKVCDNDDFVYNCGKIERHYIDFRQPRGEAYAYYAIITMKDGSKKTEVMSKADVDAIRCRSKSANNGPWVTDYDEMAKKTVFKRAAKWISLSAEIRDAIEYDDRQYATPVHSVATGGAAIVQQIIESHAETEQPATDWHDLMSKATGPKALLDLRTQIMAELPEDEAEPFVETIDERLAIIAEGN